MASLDLVYYLVAGSLAGLLSGLFGIGGGVVIVPFLVWFYSLRDLVHEKVMIVAVATSLASIVLTSISAIFMHHKLGTIRWIYVFKLLPGILMGTLIGALMADFLSIKLFKFIYAFFLIIVSIRLWMSKQPKAVQTTIKGWVFNRHGRSAIPKKKKACARRFPYSGSLPEGESDSRYLLRDFYGNVMGTFIGFVSAVLGIGGGTITVPMLIKCNVPMREAIGISSACGLPIALVGSLSYIVLGWKKLPGASLGYIDISAFEGIVVTSVLFAPVGAKLAKRLPVQRLKKSFALLLLILGSKMLWQAS